jgi:Leucine-rich repeat (LRR) protein
MKPNPTLQKLIPAVIAGLALACWPDAANASTATLPLPPSAIQPGGNPTDTTLDWGIFWNGYQGADGIATEVFDPNVSSSSSIPGSIHVNVFLPGNIASNAPTGAANLCFGDFITAGFGYTWLSANQSSAVDFSQYSALSFDILVNINTSSNTAIPIYLYSCWDNGNVQIGSVPIPATQGWQHISIPIPNNFSFNDPTAPPANGTAWGFHYWYPNNDPACSDFWIDNVQLVGAGVIPPLPSPLVAGALRRELFLNIPGSAVTDLTSSPNFPGAPDSTGLISSFETPSGLGDNYGQRLSGYLLPPVTGNYVFYIASDDQSILYLSTDSSPANKVQIAAEPRWNGPRQWVNGGNQTSRGTPPANVTSPIALQAGQAYYVEVLHKQGGGGDNLGVLWQLPGASAPANGDLPIAGAYLAYDGSQLLIRSQSGNQVVVQGGTVTLSITATGGSGTLTYQWRKDGVNLDGQTDSSLTINGATSTDTGVYTVQVQSGVVSVLSALMAVNVYVPFDTLRGDNIGCSPDMTPGSTASLGQGNFDVTTSGYGIWDTSDVFHYSYTAVVGDFDIQARIARFDNSGWYAAAGLMVRQNLSPGSANVKVIIEPPTADNSYKMEFRSSQDDSTGQINPYSGGVPVPNAWMRLKRQGNTISAYRSTDGVQWTSLGQTTQVFSEPVLVGLATTANAWPPTITTVAQYRNLQLIGTLATVGVNFPDPNLEAAVRQALGKPSGPLFAPEVAGLTWLGVSQRNIANLAGLENAINLQGLSLDNNQISDLTPLAGLTRLTFLSVGQNQVASLTPLAGLSALTSLYAWNNPISDLSVLSGFHNLVTLSLNGGTTADLSVIFGLTSLQHLELFWMNFRNLSLLQSLPNLTSLKLDGNGITDLSPLSSLVHLQSLVVSFNAIQDLSPLAGLTGLTYLDAGNNQITDLSPLRGLTQLNFLSFDQNDVSDITVLDPLTTLATVQMPNNYLDVSTGQPAYNVIQDLLARGVNVTYLPQKPFPRGLGPLLARPIFVGQTLQLLFTAGDPTQAASISSATAVSSDQTLVADGSIQVSGSGSARTLSLTANPSHSGTANITITVNYSSGTPASVSGSFPVTVLPADASAFIREMFRNIPGNSVADLTQNPAFPKQPNLVQVLRAFEAPQNVGDNYGQRLYGYLAPPVTGPYVFYIASDDQSILYLSTDSSPANKVQIATEPAWNGPRQWITGDNQTSRGNPPVNISAPITLTAGQAYYIEALHKEAGGGDNLAVAWQLPGAPAPANGAPPLPWVPPSGVFSSDFNQFNPLWPPLGTWLNGSATTYDDSTGGAGGSGVLKLTTALPSQTSTFVIDDLNGGQPIGGFIATFKLRMGGGTTPPADGFSFNFAPDIDTGALFSEEGGGSGLTVSFDTYDNGNEAPALDIDWAGQLVARQWFSGWGSAGRDLFKDPAGNPVSLETGDAFEDVRIELKPNGTVTVQYKGLTIHDNVFLPNYAPTHGRFALAARTGGSTENQFVDDLSITTTPVSSAPASILQPAQSQTVNEQGSVTFAVLPGGGAPFTFQ